MGRSCCAVLGLLLGSQLVAQERAPDAVDRPFAQLGLYALGLRGGYDLEQSGQALVGASLDVGHLYAERLRFRTVGELGFAPSPNTYVVSLELVYRFVQDTEVAIPYIGTGIGLAGSEECRMDPGCPGLWWQFVLGFELRLNRHLNWAIEYHPQDALRRHRILVGLVMRRGDA